MSNNAQDEGLPDWAKHPVVLTVAGLIVTAIVLSMFNGSSNPEPKKVAATYEAPACYRGADKEALAPGEEIFSTDSFSSWENFPNRKSTEERAIAATVACQPESCGADKATAYRKAIGKYVKQTARMVRTYYTRAGERGLEYVRGSLQNWNHRQIVAGMKVRHEAGILPYKGVVRNEDEALQMLLFREPEEFGPCRTTMASTDEHETYQ